MLHWNTLAIRKAKRIDGLYFPFSSELTVCLDTSRISASSSCFRPFPFLTVPDDFSSYMLLLCKARFTYILHEALVMSSSLYIFYCTYQQIKETPERSLIQEFLNGGATRI